VDKVDVLVQYMPAPAAPIIAKWIDYFQCEFKISKNRSTKLGDYRHPFKGKGHKISVNNDLNPYAFLVTTVHDKHKAKPHGIEWKTNFKRMMNPFFEKEVFPAEIHQTIINYLNNPAASSCTDLTLARALKKYDTHLLTTRVEELPIDTIFVLKDGRKFQKGERIRKRYRCLCLDNGKIYLFNPLAEVLLSSDT
jgi:SprT protein